MVSPLDSVLARVEKIKKIGGQYQALCPAHDDHNPSLSIREDAFGSVLLHCHAGCDVPAVVKAMGIRESDLRPVPSAAEQDPIASYEYLDESGKTLFVIDRLPEKRFRCRRPDPARPGNWEWNLSGARRVLYRLPDVLSSVADGRPLYVVEGEKDADALARAGVTATCNPHGAGKWRPEYSETLRGADVVIVQDRDEPGRKHAAQVHTSLRGVAASVRIVEAAFGKDAADHLQARFTPAQFKLVEEAMPAQDPSSEVRLVSLSEVQPEELRWLWEGRIPYGKMTVIVGDPGLGKSYLALYCSAHVSTGRPWPDGGSPEVGNVIVLTAEDGLSDTVRPRLDTLGADTTRIKAITAVRQKGSNGDRAFSLREDCERLQLAIVETGASLVIIDPLNAYLRGIDSHKAAEVRGIMAPLAAVGENTGAAILVIHHLNKGTSANALYRAGGSLDFVAAARSVLGVAPDMEQDGRVLLLPVKLNVARKPEGLGFRVAGDGILWDTQPVNVDASAAFAASSNTEDRSSLSEAQEFLVEVLTDGPILATSVKKQARQLDISDTTLKRAKRKLSVQAYKEGFSGDTHWLWSLPGDTSDNATLGAKGVKGVTSESRSSSRELDPLREETVSPTIDLASKEAKGIISQTWSSSAGPGPLRAAALPNDEPWEMEL